MEMTWERLRDRQPSSPLVYTALGHKLRFFRGGKRNLYPWVLYNTVMKSLFKIWRVMPLWVHFLAAKLIRPRFSAAVAAIVLDEQGRVLLFKHTYRKVEWGIPAGGLNHREQPQDAIVREFFEETGIRIAVERLLAVVSAREDDHLSVVYLCRMTAGGFVESAEIAEMKYFPVTELPLQMLITEKELIQWSVKELQR